MRDETSHTWLESLKNASPQATGWRYLLNSYGPFVREILTRKGLDGSLADDVAQDVMVVAAQKLPDFERQRAGSFRMWLRMITANCLRNFLKSKTYRDRAMGGSEILDLANAIADDKSQTTVMWNREHARHLVAQLLEAVSPEFSPKSIDAFRRLAIEGESVQDVSRELGMSVNACFIARSRVLKRLKGLQQELLADEERILR